MLCELFVMLHELLNWVNINLGMTH
jgi:hypothetical protein